MNKPLEHIDGRNSNMESYARTDRIADDMFCSYRVYQLVESIDMYGKSATISSGDKENDNLDKSTHACEKT